MKKFILGTFSVLVAIGFVGCANPNALTKEEVKTVKFLNSAQIKKLFSGNTIVGKVYKWDSTFELTYSADGKVTGKVANGEKDFNGKWYIKNENTSCLVRSNGSESCRKVFTDGVKYYSVNKNMVKTSEYTFK